MTRTTLLLAAALLVAATPAAPQSATPAAQSGAEQQAPPACDRPEHRQFDFWAGEWTVTTPDGQTAGHNTITPTLGGCVLHESWTGAGGTRGYSYNIYDAAAGVWHQSWVDTGGQLLVLEGGLDDDGAMVMRGERPARDGGTALHRVTWTPTPGDGVRQVWDVSRDGGATWTTVFDGRYARKR